MFGDFQKKVIACAATCVAASVVVAFAIGIVVLGAKFLDAFSTVVWPLAIATILSLLLQPICDFFETRFRFSRGLSVATLFVLVVAVAAVIAFVAIPLCLREAGDLLRKLPAIWDGAMERFPDFAAWLDANFQRGNIRAVIEENAAVPEHLQAILETWIPHVRSLLQKSGAFFGQIAAAASIPIYLYYLISERRDLIGVVERESRAIFSERVAQDIAFLARQFRDILLAFFRGQVVIGFLYGLILAAGFGLLGIPGGIVLGLCIGMLNIVPYLGTLVGLSTVLLLAFFSGGIWLALAALAVFCVAQLAESYFLTPKIMGKRTGLHPMVIMVAIFFWANALDGLLGMVLAVPLTAFFVVFWRLFKERYLPSIVR